ncbi:MAG: DUF417 family protein [Acidobacteriaceae bacterium]
MMNPTSPEQTKNVDKEGMFPAPDLSIKAESRLIQLAAWITDRNLSFFVISVGMIVMLLWASLFKMTASGAEAITPWVTHNPLISWQFKIFGPHIGSDMIGFTEIIAALLFIVGYFRAKAGIVGGLITTAMFFVTSTMFITTPGTIVSIHGMKYMSFLGLFLFKDVIACGASLFLVGNYGKRALLPRT